MPSTVLVSVFCPDRTGLVSAITGCLWELGANLADTGFSVLGGGAEFSGVCDLPDDVTIEDVDRDLRRLPELADAEVSVRPFAFDPQHGPEGDVTHRITVSGGDQPGLVARLCETLVEFRANVVSLNAGPSAAPGRTYVIRLAVSIPEDVADSCIATIGNTAEALGLAWTADRF